MPAWFERKEPTVAWGRRQDAVYKGLEHGEGVSAATYMCFVSSAVDLPFVLGHIANVSVDACIAQQQFHDAPMYL
jgi:hypothetical protein